MDECIMRSELLRIERLLDTDVLRASETASVIYDQMMYDIEHIPAADVVKVVRCNDCIKYMTRKCFLCSFTFDGYCTGGPNGDFFCADGIRRDNNG